MDGELAAEWGPRLHPDLQRLRRGARGHEVTFRTALVVALLLCAAARPARAQFWASPLERITLGASAASEHDRTYFTAIRPRQMAGGIALSCEYQDGAPCGDGARAALDLDSRAGFGDLLTAETRLRAYAGTESGLEVHRAVLRLAYGVLRVQVGRDTLTLGPSVRSALMVSSNAAPQDGVRLQLLPVQLFGSGVRLSLLYFIDRLRDPQRFTHTLLDCTRAQLDFGGVVQLGGSRMLELGGQGAPDFGGFEGFILEHFGRTREGHGTAENNRLSFDLAVRIAPQARAYYEIAFEDTRSRLWNSFQYDADHLLGLDVELPGRRRIFAELLHTGWVSQEHWLFTEGMTNRGRTLGPATGPDTTSVWLRAEAPAGPVRVGAWGEWMRFGSDRYGSNQEVGVFVTQRGPLEHRLRAGADVEAPLAKHWVLSAALFAERIAGVDFVAGTENVGTGLRAALTFTP